ncbi:hypothetical protein GCG21_01165 [Pseudactinotalea sp. HY160]|uniref:hypothetical protein n=1 Tax=Pseudactinotalea sp. HY160 TaxID=2654490 RepID=UPI00128CB47F|nr:hypothetical protein [Pseudactinotalea sp. HY160]MPV48642.1 hypothetical protein [Pseudactinotalea sp. HY160]
MVPIHFAEVATRNAVDKALTRVYGTRWPWNMTFERSLPDPRQSTYSPRKDLVRTRGQHGTTGKVIADLKFVFWETMFTSRHDQRLWLPQITELFPDASVLEPKALRNDVRERLGEIRSLRNRIAHHEPIFTRDLRADLRGIMALIEIRSPATARFAFELEQARMLIDQRPTA